MAEDYVNKLFRLIETIAENQEPLEITNDLVVRAIKKLKKKKATDEEKWTNEIILKEEKKWLTAQHICLEKYH